MSEKTRKETGKALTGEERIYTFKLLDAKPGLQLFHKYSPKLLDLWVKVQDTSQDGFVFELIRKLPTVLDWDDIEYLATKLLGNSTVELDNEIIEIDETGIGEYTIGDPMEVYTALFWAINANYPKYLAPLFPKPATSQDDTNQDSTQAKSKKK